jgi:hypothetical protein
LPRLRAPRHGRLVIRSLIVLGCLLLLTSPIFSVFLGSHLGATAHAAGASYFVSTKGLDSNPGTYDRPWLTIYKATRTVQPGDTVQVRGGKYREFLRVLTSGTASAPITFKAYPGETVILEGDDATQPAGVMFNGKSYVLVENLTIQGFKQGVSCEAPGHHLTVKGNIIQYNFSAGVSSAGSVSGSLDACDYLTVESNVIHHNGFHLNGQLATGSGEGWSSAVSINPDYAPYHYDSDYSKFHIIIRGNTIYHNYDGTGGDADNDTDHSEGHGVIIDKGGVNSPPALIENNVIFDNGGECIHPLGSHNIWAVGNTCYKNAADPLAGWPNTQAEIAGYSTINGGERILLKNVHVLNNIACADDRKQITYFPDINIDDPSEVDMRNNLWYGNPYREDFSPYGTDYAFAPPSFVNATTDPEVADFRLNRGSRAIDLGTSQLGADIQQYDFDGTTRPLGDGYDAGAYEYVSSGQATVGQSFDHRVFLPYVFATGDGRCR